MKPSRPYHAVTDYHREPGGLRRLDFFVDRIASFVAGRDPASIRILDIGCGKGNVALPLAAIGYRVTGVDLDELSIAEADQLAREFDLPATFLKGSFGQVAGQQFDVVLASEVFEHQDDPAEFLDLIRSVCVADPLILFSVPNGHSLEERIRRVTTHTSVGRSIKHFIKRRIGHETVQSEAEHPHVQFFSWKALRNVLDAGGYVVAESAPAAAWFKEWFYLGGRIIMRRGSFLFHTLDALDGWLASHLPRRIADGWLLEMRLRTPGRTRVLQILTTLSAGGAERVVYELASHLPDHGFGVHVLSLFGAGPLESLFIDARIPLTVCGRTHHSWWAAFRACRQVIDMERPRIVHTHLFGADVLGRLAAWMAGVPLVISTEHNVNVDHGFIKRLCKTLLALTTDVFVAVSHVVREHMVRYEGIPRERVEVIHNGINVSHIAARPHVAFHDVPRLVTVGRLVPQKGHDILLRGLAHITSPWRLEIAGLGENKAELQHLAEHLGIASRIHWSGYQADVPALLAASDVFCFPSRYEGLSLALIEAAVAGIPIVASDLPVFHEIATSHEVTFVPSTEPEVWAEAINKVLRHPEQAFRSAQTLSHRARETFSVERMTKHYAEAYKRLLARTTV